jgi:hypothetical protein
MGGFSAAQYTFVLTIILERMSYKVTIDIVMALQALRISSFRKQGLLRFRITLAEATLPESPPTNKKVPPPAPSRPPHQSSALPTTSSSTNDSRTCPFTQPARRHAEVQSAWDSRPQSASGEFGGAGVQHRPRGGVLLLARVRVALPVSKSQNLGVHLLSLLSGRGTARDLPLSSEGAAPLCARGATGTLFSM